MQRLWEQGMGGLRVFYRLSDKGENKVKLPEVSNRQCLEDFLRQFPADAVTVIADNVGEETFAWLLGCGVAEVVRTALGNCGSFWEGYRRALELDDDCAVYFVENDYLHREGARAALLEGLAIADYVTLYDHPDKYADGDNPLVAGGSEASRVWLTGSCHWKQTNSTTMTFAARVKTLRADRWIFRNFTVGTMRGQSRLLRYFQAKRLPNDYRIFRYLARLKRRRLISPIPAFSTHGETAWIAPFFLHLRGQEPVQ